jgi:phosphatidate cytidylyltransferase
LSQQADTDVGVTTKASELKLRIISALALAAGILAATWLGGWPFKIVWAIVGGLMSYEWLRIMGVERPMAVLASGLVMVSAALVGLVSFGPLALMIGALVAAAAGASPGLRLLGMIGIAYGAVIAFGPTILRNIPVHGLTIIVWTFAVVWTTDVAAYFTGRALGGPKLSPRFSPKKTWSGAVGGAVAGTLAGMGIWWISTAYGHAPPMSLMLCGVLSLVASALGQVGDIAESAFKRRFGVKDSGTLIPGHGGFMDRLDAYWSVIAFAVLVLTIGRFV